MSNKMETQQTAAQDKNEKSDNRKHEEQKFDMIFVGPQAAGKTTLFQMLKGEKPNGRYVTTQSGGISDKIKLHICCWGSRLFKDKLTVLDTGGGEYDFYKKWMNRSKIIVVVLNEVKFLESLSSPETGSEETSFCRFILSNLDVKNIKLYFVVTHNDEFKGVSKRDEILRKLQTINKEHVDLFGTKRYPFDMTGRLYEVNAKDKDSVTAVFKEIVQ